MYRMYKFHSLLPPTLSQNTAEFRDRRFSLLSEVEFSWELAMFSKDHEIPYRWPDIVVLGKVKE